MKKFFKTTQGIIVNIGENGIYPTESELVFGLAYKDGVPARYTNTNNPDEPKFLLVNDEYELYAYITQEQKNGLMGADNMWTALKIMLPPTLEEFKAMKLKPFID